MLYAFLAVEFAIVSILLLGAYRLRKPLGMSAVVAVVASLQFLQAVLGTSFYWPFEEGLLLSPGSCVFFASNIAILLFAHAEDGPDTSRKLLYAVITANVTVSLLSLVVGFHIDSVAPHNLLDVNPDLFESSVVAAMGGIASLYFSQLLAILTFSWIRERWSSLHVSVPMSAALILSLGFDTVFFVGLLFYDNPDVGDMLLSGIISKGAGGLAYGVIWGLYLQTRVGDAVHNADRMLPFLLFRTDIESLRQAAVTDPLTKLHNRRMYNRVLQRAAEKGGLAGEEAPFALLLVDADNFKSVNDELGHAKGDEVLVEMSDSIRAAIRGEDYAFRIGGDEFAIILPDCRLAGAQKVAERVAEYQFSHPELDNDIALTVGIALWPSDASDADALFEVADARLYAGKDVRDRVVAS